MKRIIGVLTILCVFGLPTTAVVQSARTSNESSLAVQGTLMAIDGPFYVIMDSTGKELCVHVDTSTMISDGKTHPALRALKPAHSLLRMNSERGQGACLS